jgi:hypothetical protein
VGYDMHLGKKANKAAILQIVFHVLESFAAIG